MQKKSAGSENLKGVGGSMKDGAAKIWGQLVVGLLSNFKNRILRGWLSVPAGPLLALMLKRVIDSGEEGVAQDRTGSLLVIRVAKLLGKPGAGIVHLRHFNLAHERCNVPNGWLWLMCGR